VLRPTTARVALSSPKLNGHTVSPNAAPAREPINFRGVSDNIDMRPHKALGLMTPNA